MLVKTYSSSELSSEAYHADREFESASNLKNILETPVHYLFGIENPDEETEPQKIGTAVHAAMLEPEIYNDKFVVGPKFDLRKKDDKAAHQAFRDAHPGKTIVQAKDQEFIDKLRIKIRKHPTASKLLMLPGESESSIFWIDDETGIKLKCRPDRLIMLGRTPIYISVKTTASAAKEAFSYDVDKYDYHLAEAMYRDGIYQRLGYLPQVLWLVIEKKTWEVCVYKPDSQMLELGYERYRRAIHQLKQCRDTGIFNGYQPEGNIEEISLPRRALRRETQLSQMFG